MIELARNHHRDFVDLMWDKFGLSQHPGYCILEIKPLFSQGGFRYDPDTIVLNDTLSDDLEIKATTYHETTHFLNPFARMLHEKKLKTKEKDRLLHETLANLGVMIFLEIKKEEVRQYFSEKHTYSQLLARDILEGNKSLLNQLAQIDMDKAKELIAPHLKRPLQMRKSPYSIQK